MADLTALEAIEKRIAASGRPMTRAEASTLAPLRIKRRKDEEANQPKPKSRAEAATQMKQAKASTDGDRYKGLREVPAKVGEAVLDTATSGMYSAAKTAAPMVKKAIEFMGQESSQPVRNRAEAATYMKNRNASQPASSAGDEDLKSFFDAVEKARQNPPVSFMEKLQNAGTQEEPTLKDYSRPTESVEMGSERTEQFRTPSESTGPATSEQVRSPMEAQMAAPKAPELDETRMAQLYRKTTGAEYNPEVSKAAREKMAQLKSFVSSNPDMLNKSDTRIALDFYKTLK